MISRPAQFQHSLRRHFCQGDIRVLRTRRLWELFERTESSTCYPNSFRMAVLLFYLLLVIHWNACVYFVMSAYNGFGSDRWVYFDINETLYPRNATLLKMYTYRCFIRLFHHVKHIDHFQHTWVTGEQRPCINRAYTGLRIL